MSGEYGGKGEVCRETGCYCGECTQKIRREGGGSDMSGGKLSGVFGDVAGIFGRFPGNWEYQQFFSNI